MIRRYLYSRLFGPAVPAVALIDVIGALIALLLVLASGLLQRAIKALFSGAGFPVDAVGSFLAGAVASAVGAIQAATTYAVSPVANFIAGPVIGWWRWLAQLADTGAAIVGLAGYALHVAEQAVVSGSGALASDVAALTAEIEGVASGVTAHIDQVYKTLAYDLGVSVGDLLGNISAVYHYALGWYDAGTAHIDQVYKTLAYDLTTNVADIFDHLAGDVSALDAAIGAGVAGAVVTAEHYTVAAVAGVLDEATTRAEDLVNAGIATLEQVAQADVVTPWAELLPYLGTIADALPADIVKALGLDQVLKEAVPASIAGILAMILPAIAALGVETVDCVIPQCRNLGNLSQLLQELQSDVFLALLIALLAEVAAHPSTATNDIEGALGAAVTDTANAFRALIGV